MRTPVVVVVAVVVLGIVAYGWMLRQQERQPVLRIEPVSLQLRQGASLQMKALFDSDGIGNKSEEDVTHLTDWTTDNPLAAYIGNAKETKGMLVAPGRGDVTVTASFNDLRVLLYGVVEEVPLEIACAPATKKPMPAGETVEYILFASIGAQNYTYQWEAPENQTSKDTFPLFVFRTPGEKVVNVTVTNRAGKVTKVSCAPLQVI